MATEIEDMIICKERVDSLTDVPYEFEDCEELGGITSSEKGSEATISDESEINRRKLCV